MIKIMSKQVFRITGNRLKLHNNSVKNILQVHPFNRLLKKEFPLLNQITKQGVILVQFCIIDIVLYHIFHQHIIIIFGF